MSRELPAERDLRLGNCPTSLGICRTSLDPGKHRERNRYRQDAKDRREEDPLPAGGRSAAGKDVLLLKGRRLWILDAVMQIGRAHV